MKKILVLLILFLGVISSRAQLSGDLEKNDSDNTLLWEISGNGLEKPSYLFGTFHMMCKDDIHFSNNLKQAFESSDKVYMEIKLDDPVAMMGAMQYMMMKDGKTLKDLYTDEEYNRLENFFKDSLKMPLAFLQGMKPMFLTSLFIPKMMDCPGTSGVEMELISLAKEDGKEIMGLETIQFQAAVFDSIPYEMQARELLKNIDSLDIIKRDVMKMVCLYREQRLDSLADLINKDEMTGEQFGDILLTNRNKNWVEQLNPIMKNESVFVAVGAGHLPGEKGVISLLKEEGYDVKPLKNSD